MKVGFGVVEPAFFLNEIEEHEAVERGEREQAVFFFGLDELFCENGLEGGFEIFEEAFGNFFDIEGRKPLFFPSVARVVALERIGQGEIGEIVFAKGAQVRRAVLPREGLEFSGSWIFAGVVGEGEVFVVGRADEEEVFECPSFVG